MRCSELLHQYTYDWSQTRLYLVAIGLVIGVSWLWYSLIYIPLSCAVDMYEAQVAPAAACALTAQDARNTCNALSCEVDKLQQQLCDALKKCTCSSSDAVIAQFFALCDEHQITIHSFKPISVIKEETYTKERFACEFIATHLDAQNLYKALQTSNMLVGVPCASATAQQDSLFAHTCVLEHVILA